MASAGGHNRSLVFKVRLFLPTESKIGDGGEGGDCDNDGSTNEGGNRKGVEVRATHGSSSKWARLTLREGRKVTKRT